MEILPHEGVGAIRFGMIRAEVRKLASSELPERGRRSPIDEADYDHFKVAGFFAYYDVRDCLTAIEFTGDGQAVYDGFDLCGHSALEVCSWAKDRDANLTFEPGAGFTSKALGISVYAPWLDDVEELDDSELEQRAESVLVFPVGYYEREEERLETLRKAKGGRLFG